MATIRQQRLVKNLQENIGTSKSLGKVIEASGFAPSTARHPAKILKSKGVLQLFKEAGISGQIIVKKWQEILELPLKEKAVSIDARRKTLESLSSFILNTDKPKIMPQILFIDKFLNLQSLEAKRGQPSIRISKKGTKDK